MTGLARRWWRWLPWSVLVVLTAGAPAGALELVDDRGARVQLAASPRRIVSVLPSLTEMVCDLGACQRLVGVDRYSNHPASVRTLPRVTAAPHRHLRARVEVRPDVGCDLCFLAAARRAGG